MITHKVAQRARMLNCLKTHMIIAKINLNINEKFDQVITFHPVISSDPVIACTPVRSFTGMDLITGMDYRNGHIYLSLSTFHLVFEDKLA